MKPQHPQQKSTRISTQPFLKLDREVDLPKITGLFFGDEPDFKNEEWARNSPELKGFRH